MATRAKPSSTDDLIDALRRDQRALVDAYMRELVPTYDRHQQRLQDMREAGELIIRLLLLAASERRPIRHEEYNWLHGYLRRAMLRGASEIELIRAARVWQRVMYDAVTALAGADGAALVAEFSGQLIDHVDQLSDLTIQVVEELQAAMRLTSREERADLIHDLLAGRLPAAAAQQQVARACGLSGNAPIVVISARPVDALPDAAAGPVAAVALAHATGDAVEPLFTIRDDEIVIVRATADDPEHLIAALRKVRDRLAKDGVTITVGISAVHPGISEVPAAYEQATLARERAADTTGVLAIATMSPLDYLFTRGADETAWNLVDPRIRAFVMDDLAQAGLLIETLNAYVDTSLNAKQAAEKLFVHTNTAHYRLAKIEELTGKNLRDLRDLQELVIAVRLARLRVTSDKT